MLDRIKNTIFEKFWSEEKKWVFFSGYDSAKNLLFSHGVVHTDKSLRNVLEDVYKTHVQARLDEARYLAIDVMLDIIEITNQDDIRDLSPKEFGFLVVDKEDETTGIMLPNTTWVDDVKTVLYTIKQKYGIHGKVTIYAFRTERFVVAK